MTTRNKFSPEVRERRQRYAKGPDRAPLHIVMPRHQWPAFTPPRWPGMRPPLTRWTAGQLPPLSTTHQQPA